MHYVPAQTRRRMLERQLTEMKKGSLQEIDHFFTNLSPEIYNMTLGDLMKLQLGHSHANVNKENSTTMTKLQSGEADTVQWGWCLSLK